MHVVVVSKAFVRGAYQRKLQEIAKLGAKVTLVTPPGWIDGGRRVDLERQFTTGYDLVTTPVVFDGHFHTYFYPKLRGILRSLRPDVVHCDEEPYNLAAVETVLLARSLGAVPVFFTWQNLRRSYPPPFGLFEQYVYRQCPVAIAGNADAQRVLRGKGFRGEVRVIPQFGFDPELYQPMMPEDKARPFTIGFIGRLIPAKGVFDLLEAASGLEGDWQLAYVGSGPAGAELLAAAQERQVSDRVSVRPEVQSVEVPRLLSSLDVLVLPSRSTPSWKEQFGRVLVESMLCGVPVIGSDSGEIPNVIGSGGLVFPEGDVQALGSSLARLQHDRDLRSELAARGRQSALARFSQNEVAAAHFSVYQAAVSQSIASSGAR